MKFHDFFAPQYVVYIYTTDIFNLYITTPTPPFEQMDPKSYIMIDGYVLPQIDECLLLLFCCFVMYVTIS